MDDPTARACEAIRARPAGRELDVAIATQRMGWARQHRPGYYPWRAASGRQALGVPPYSTDPAAALDALNTFPYWQMSHGADGYACSIPSGDAHETGETFALAACRAVLVALVEAV
jgi:hypothetical protein